MAITVKETFESRELTMDNRGPKAVFRYFAVGSIDETAVYQAVLAASPDDFQGLIRRLCTVKTKGGGYWNGEVDYELPEGQALPGQGGESSPDQGEQPKDTDPLGLELNFDTTGGTQHITQSKSTRSTTVRTGFTGPALGDTQQAIGTTEDSVSGCDVVAPRLEFSISRRVAFITLKGIRALNLATGCINNTAYLGFEEGELLFLGASGQFRHTDGWTITYKFAGSRNLKSPDDNSVLKICDGLIVPEKRGWEYVWVGYKKKPAAAGLKPILVPYFVNVERVYRAIEFRDYLGW